MRAKNSKLLCIKNFYSYFPKTRHLITSYYCSFIFSSQSIQSNHIIEQFYIHFLIICYLITHFISAAIFANKLIESVPVSLINGKTGRRVMIACLHVQLFLTMR